MFVVFIAALLAAVAFILFSYRDYLHIERIRSPFTRDGAVSWIDFYSKGRESGFSVEEIRLLRALAKKSNMEHPAALFWSTVQMDSCLAYIVRRYMNAETFDGEENEAFLDKLFILRNKLEMEKPRWKTGIANTNEISEMQPLQIVTEKYGAFNAKVIKNSSAAIGVERPESAAMPVDSPWKGQPVQVYFRRKEDAAYSFKTVVVEEIFDAGQPSLTLLHNNKLTRAQNRNYIRTAVRKPARMFAFNPDDPGGQNAQAGIRCSVRDVSENGCKIKTGGRAQAALKVIIHFFIDKTAINIEGTVRSVSYNEKANTSILHIQSDLMPLDVKNRIRCIVFGIVDDDFAFKDTAEDAASEGDGGSEGIIQAAAEDGSPGSPRLPPG